MLYYVMMNPLTYKYYNKILAFEPSTSW